MYIIVIGWIYAVLMVSVTRASIVSGVITFLLLGVAPMALLLWIFGTGKRRRASAVAEKDVDNPDGGDAKGDQH